VCGGIGSRESLREISIGEQGLCPARATCHHDDLPRGRVDPAGGVHDAESSGDLPKGRVDPAGGVHDAESSGDLPKGRVDPAGESTMPNLGETCPRAGPAPPLGGV